MGRVNEQNRRKYNNPRRNNREKNDLPKCPVCEKHIRDVYSAVSYSVTQTPAHFNCILNELKDANELKPNEKICYLGSGSFGIVQFRGPESPIRIFIRKRIQYEEKDNNPEWREKLPLKTSL